MSADKVKPQPTPKEVVDQINAMFNANAQLLGALRDRWQDESDYEDLGAYRTRLEREMPAGFHITAMQKRPFGFRFTVDAFPTGAYEMFAKATRVEWKRVQ